MCEHDRAWVYLRLCKVVYDLSRAGLECEMTMVWRWDGVGEILRGGVQVHTSLKKKKMLMIRLPQDEEDVCVNLKILGNKWKVEKMASRNFFPWGLSNKSVTLNQYFLPKLSLVNVTVAPRYMTTPVLFLTWGTWSLTGRMIILTVAGFDSLSPARATRVKLSLPLSLPSWIYWEIETSK